MERDFQKKMSFGILNIFISTIFNLFPKNKTFMEMS